MMNKYLLSFIVLVLVISCKTESNEPSIETQIFIDNSKIETTLDISEIVSTVSIIQLKEPSNNYLADVLKAETTKDHYLFFDRQTNKINVYTKNGDFVKTLCKAGEAENQPLNISALWTTDKGIQVYDFAQMKIFTYDLNFNHVSNTKSNQFNHYSSINKLPNSDKYFAYANYNMINESFNDQFYQLAVLDKSLSVEKTFEYYDKKFRGVLLLSFPHHFKSFSDSLRFFKAYDNYIYNVTDSSIKKRYKINYLKNELPENIYSILDDHLAEFKNTQGDVNKLYNHFNKYARFSGNWLESNSYAYFTSFQYDLNHGNLFSTLYHKNSSKSYSGRQLVDFNKYKIRFPYFQHFDPFTNEFVAIIDGSYLNTLVDPSSPLYPNIVSSATVLHILKLKLK